MALKRETGFTLVELLVTTLLMVIVMGAMYSVHRVQTHTVKAQEFRMEAQEYARAALDMMVREMRNSGYFPNRVPCPAPANTTGIVAASAQNFQFVYDADGDNDCAGPNENITYAFNAGDITRAADGGAAQTLTDGNVTAFQFVYYPQQTGPTTPPPYCFTFAPGDPPGCIGTLPTNLANIQRVSVTTTVQSKSTDTQFGGQQPLTMMSNVDLRNRGLLP